MDGNKREVMPVDQPVYYVQQAADDEIDLVDLWIALTAYGKSFMLTALVFSVIGIVAVGLLHHDKYPLRSIIDMDSLVNQVGFNDSPSALITRIKLGILPRLKLHAANEEFSAGIDALKFSVPKQTNMIVLESITNQQDIEFYTTIHGQLIDEVVRNLETRALSVKKSLQKEIALKETQINDLKRESVLLNQEIQDRAAISNELQISDAGLDHLKNEVELRESVLQKEMKLIVSELSELELRLAGLVPNIVLQASISDERSGMSAKLAYVLVVFVSLFLSLFVTLGRIFAQKVKQRRAGEG